MKLNLFCNNTNKVAMVVIATYMIGFSGISLYNSNMLSNELNNQKQIVKIKDGEIEILSDTLMKYQTQISEYQTQISEYQSIISDLTNQFQSASEKITELESRVQELTSELEKKNSSFLGEFSVSFYTPTDGSATGITATGNPAIPYHTVAVDPNVIPLGTKLYIENFGEVIADDVGGAIKGNRLDYCVSTVNEAYSYGVQTLKVWIIE